MSGRWRRILASALPFIALGGCGSSPSLAGSSTSPHPVTLTVLGAASLTNVFPDIGELFTKHHPGVRFRFSFAGTDQLAAQIEQGAPADVFAGASTKYGDRLFEEGLVAAPRPFCTNSLVLILPRSNPAGIGSLRDLTEAGTKLVIAADSVPAGAYTRTVLQNLELSFGPRYADRVLANVVSNEQNVEGVLTKVRLGEADAGFVYVTDSLAAGSDVEAIDLPPLAPAIATYPIAVVGRSANGRTARLFADFVLTADAQAILRRAGFGPPRAS
jgi:molybdate transport system substrate-binding protein